VLLERDTVPAYARVVPAAVKVPAERIVPTLLDPRLDANRVVLLAEDAPIDLPRLDSLPAASASRASVTTWEPGAMTVRMDPVPETDSYLLVSENWYPDWQATVDGRPVVPLKGDFSLLAVPVPRGAREVKLVIRSTAYRRGAAVSLASLGVILAWLLLPALQRRRHG
jgi:hypothetical protein